MGWVQLVRILLKFARELYHDMRAAREADRKQEIANRAARLEEELDRARDERGRQDASKTATVFDRFFGGFGGGSPGGRVPPAGDGDESGDT